MKISAPNRANSLKLGLVTAAITGAYVVGNVHGETQQSSADQRLPATKAAAYATAKALEAQINNLAEFQPVTADASELKSYVSLKVWQGIVERKTANGWESAYTDPIILARGSTKTSPVDDKTKPSYLGIVTGTTKSGVQIVPLEYTSDMRFSPAAPADQIERPVNAYPTTYDNGIAEISIEMQAFDPSGQEQVTHPYGGGSILPGSEVR